MRRRSIGLEVVISIVSRLEPHVILRMLRTWLEKGDNRPRAKMLCVEFSNPRTHPETADHINYKNGEPVIKLH